MISCRRAAELTSLQLDTELHFGQKLALGIHRGMCAACRRFGRQLLDVNDATREFLIGESSPSEPMPDEARIRIRSNLDSATSAE